MTNKERKERAYQNRVASREAKKEMRAIETTEPEEDEEELFARLFVCGLNCTKGTSWKKSAQLQKMFLLTRTCKLQQEYEGGTWTPSEYAHHDINERGKLRHIDAAPIQDRELHKEICNYVLAPLYRWDTIYDNGACLTGRGYNFALKTFEQELVDYHAHYGTAGAVIRIDMDDYFPNADHDEIKRRHGKYIRVPRVCAVLDCATDHIGTRMNEKGLPLGVELSQTEMVSLANCLDNYAKCQMGLKYYGRYMDDIHILVPPDRDPQEVLDEFIAEAERHHFVINREKTKILPLTGDIPFCKATFRFTETGGVERHGSEKSFRKAMRKITAFKKKVDAGEMTIADARASLCSSVAYFNNYDDHWRVLQIERKFYATFGEPLIKPKHKKK